MSQFKSIVLLSGGMDSLLIMAKAHKRNDDIYPIFFTYGQKTQQKELECFESISDFYQIDKSKRRVIDISVLKNIGGSSLTDKEIKVEVELSKKNIPNSYVPFRNSIFLSLATSLSEVIKADKIIIGAVLEDASGYPDCRPEYYWAFQELIKKGASHNSVEIETPIIRMTKDNIAKECIELEAPLELTWSCYKSSDIPCGACDSCLLRGQAFQNIQRTDPLL